jgi:hypothetical protein
VTPLNPPSLSFRGTLPLSDAVLQEKHTIPVLGFVLTLLHLCSLSITFPYLLVSSRTPSILEGRAMGAFLDIIREGAHAGIIGHEASFRLPPWHGKTLLLQWI